MYVVAWLIALPSSLTGGVVSSHATAPGRHVGSNAPRRIVLKNLMNKY
jgi:hypothetical protein